MLRIALCCLGLFAAAPIALACSATQDAPTPAATVRVVVPETPGQWPARFLLGVPDAVDLDELETQISVPLSVLHPTTGKALPTQVEVVERDPDGSPRSLFVAARMPSGLQAGEEIELQVVQQPQPFSGPALTPAVLAGLTQGKTWTMTVEGLKGGFYQAQFSKISVERLGAVEVVWRSSAPLLPLMPEADPKVQLPHLGVLTLDVRAWAGVDALDVRLLWEGGVVDQPLAWTLFRAAYLRMPGGSEPQMLIPTQGVGAPITLPTSTFLPLAQRGEDLYTTVPHHAKLWSVGLAVQGAWKGVEGILRGGGWGWADEGPWSPEQTTPTAAELPIPDMEFLGRGSVAARARAERDEWIEGRSSGAPIGDLLGLPAGPWRHASGVGYGGATGGIGVEPWPHYDLAWADPAATYEMLLARMESRLDRTRTSFIHLDGRSWDPSTAPAPFNVAISPGQLWGDSWQNAWPSSSQDPFGFRDAQPQYREETQELAKAALVYDRSYGTDDVQHWSRGRLGIWPLAELYAEPMARFVLQRQAAALRADMFDGAGDNYYTTTMSWMAARDGEGQPLGREFGWAGHHQALAYALGSDAERARLERWCELYVDIVSDSLIENGLFQIIKGGKELSASREAAAKYGGTTDLFWPAVTYQHCLVQNGALSMLGAFADDQSSAAMRTSLGRISQALCTLAWGDQASQPDYRFAAQWETGEAIMTREEVEAAYATTIHTSPFGNSGQSFHVCLAFAAALVAGDLSPEVTAAAERFWGPDFAAGARAQVAANAGNGLVLMAALAATE